MMIRVMCSRCGGEGGKHAFKGIGRSGFCYGCKNRGYIEVEQTEHAQKVRKEAIAEATRRLGALDYNWEECRAECGSMLGVTREALAEGARRILTTWGRDWPADVRERYEAALARFISGGLALPPKV